MNRRLLWPYAVKTKSSSPGEERKNLHRSSSLDKPPSAIARRSWERSNRRGSPLSVSSRNGQGRARQLNDMRNEVQLSGSRPSAVSSAPGRCVGHPSIRVQQRSRVARSSWMSSPVGRCVRPRVRVRWRRSRQCSVPSHCPDRRRSLASSWRLDRYRRTVSSGHRPVSRLRR